MQRNPQENTNMMHFQAFSVCEAQLSQAAASASASGLAEENVQPKMTPQIWWWFWSEAIHFWIWNHDMFRIWKFQKASIFFGSAITWKPGWNGMGLERQWIGVLSWSDSLITSLSLAVSRNKWVCAKVGYVPQNSKSNQEDDDQSVNFRVPYQTNPTVGLVSSGGTPALAWVWCWVPWAHLAHHLGHQSMKLYLYGEVKSRSRQYM